MEQTSGEPRGSTDQLTSWLIAAVVALVALAGLGGLIVLITLMLDLPDWVQIVIGVALVGAAVAFAWLLASALRTARARARR